LPSRFHHLLLEQFTINHHFFEREEQILQSLAKKQSNWAVWVLIKYQRLLVYNDFDLMERPKSVRMRYSELLESFKVSQLDFSGFSGDERLCVEDLINASENIIKIESDHGAYYSAIENYINIIKRYLSYPDLVGWLAYKCANNFFFSPFTRRGRIELLSPYPESRDLLLSLWRGFRAYLPKSTSSSEVTEDETQMFSFMRSAYFPPSLSSKDIPGRTRLEMNGEPVSIVDLFADYISDGAALPYSWMKYIPLYCERLLRPLLEKCNENIPFLLELIDSTSFTPFPSIFSVEEGPVHSIRFINFREVPSLSASDIQRILKVVRKTDNPKILSGGLIALSSSKFMSFAGVDLTIKMIQASFEKANIISNIFDRRSYDDLNRENKDILDQVARYIIKHPTEFAFQVSCSAAIYLADYPPSGLLPLLTLENEFGLHIRKN